MEELVNKKTDAELVSLAGSSVIGTPSGLQAQHAQAELTRRNTEALKRSSESAEKYSKAMLALTYVVIMIAVGQFMFVIDASEHLGDWRKISYLAMFVLPIVSFFYLVDRKIFESIKN